MIELIKNNITWIKDLFTLVFAGTATILSILTYKKAKATILQPIRNEAIKRQSEVLSNLLKFLPNNLSELLEKIDYRCIIRANTFSILHMYGFILKEHKEIMKNIDEIVAGSIYCGKSDTIETIEKIQTFDEISQKKEEKPYGKILYERAKQGIINIEFINITKKHITFMKELSDYAKNPFLSKKIQSILEKLILDINKNLTIHIKQVFEDFMKEFCKRHFANEEIGKISPDGIYNAFNEKRINHMNDLNQLSIAIRTVLMIDEKW